MTGEGFSLIKSHRYSKSVVVAQASAPGRRFRANHFADRQLSCASLVEDRSAQTKRWSLVVRRLNWSAVHQLALGLTAGSRLL